MLFQHLICSSTFAVAPQYIPFILQHPFFQYIQNFLVNLKFKLLLTLGTRNLHKYCNSVLSWESIKLLIEMYLESTKAQKWKSWSGVFRIWGHWFFLLTAYQPSTIHSSLVTWFTLSTGWSRDIILLLGTSQLCILGIVLAKIRCSWRMRSRVRSQEIILFCGYHMVGLHSEKMLALLKLVTCNLFAVLFQLEITFPCVINHV